MTTWPTHADGSNKIVGDMTPEERERVLNAARRRDKAKLLRGPDLDLEIWERTEPHMRDADRSGVFVTRGGVSDCLVFSLLTADEYADLLVANGLMTADGRRATDDRFIPFGTGYARMMDAARDLPPIERKAFISGVQAAGRYLIDHEARFRPAWRAVMQRLAEELDMEVTKL